MCQERATETQRRGLVFDGGLSFCLRDFFQDSKSLLHKKQRIWVSIDGKLFVDLISFWICEGCVLHQQEHNNNLLAQKKNK